jgi:hypothetical protein
MIESYSTMRDMSAVLQCRECAKEMRPKKERVTQQPRGTDATPNLTRQPL